MLAPFGGVPPGLPPAPAPGPPGGGPPAWGPAPFGPPGGPPGPPGPPAPGPGGAPGGRLIGGPSASTTTPYDAISLKYSGNVSPFFAHPPSPQTSTGCLRSVS